MYKEMFSKHEKLGFHWFHIASNNYLYEDCFKCKYSQINLYLSINELI